MANGPQEPVHFMHATANFDEEFVRPMREELTHAGFKELYTPEDVEQTFAASKGVAVVVVNSVCGCAGAKARPAVRYALEKAGTKPDHLLTVFAGQEKAATAKAREYFAPYPPSSPSVAILKDGQLAYFMERRDIETRDALSVANDLIAALDKVSAS